MGLRGSGPVARMAATCAGGGATAPPSPRHGQRPAGEPEPGTASQESHSDCMAGPPTDNAGWSHDHHDHLPVHRFRAAGPPRPRPRPRVRRANARRASLGARDHLRCRPPCARRVLGRHLHGHVSIRAALLHAAARRPVRRHPEPRRRSTPSSQTRPPAPTRVTAATASTSSTTPASSAGTSARRSGRRRPRLPECRSPSTSRCSTPRPGMPRCEGVAVYAWHADAQGRYSMYSQGVENENYLRGVQPTDAAGTATFTTVFPGCYDGRWPHIHFEVYRSTAEATSDGQIVRTSQIALPQAASARRPTPTRRRTRRARRTSRARPSPGTWSSETTAASTSSPRSPATRPAATSPTSPSRSDAGGGQGPAAGAARLTRRIPAPSRG